MAFARQPCVALHGKRCVYCQQSFQTGERSFAVLGSTRYTGHTDGFEIPPIGLIGQRYGVLHSIDQIEPQRCTLCLRPDCHTCTDSPDSYVAHQECLDILASLLPWKLSCNEIWDVGVAIKPWFSSPAEDTVFKSSKGEWEIRLLELELSETTKLVRKLVALPEELFRMIMWDKADRSALARFILVSKFNMDLVHKVRKRPLAEFEFDFTSARLRAFDFTFLGIYYHPFFKSTHPPTDMSVIRLGVDHLGIRTAEILEGYPTTGSQRSTKSIWYFVEDLARACARFKLVLSGPFLRLVSRNHEKIQLWNVINPPQPESYHSAGSYSTSPRRTRCINLSAATGLTVFCDNQSTYGIHPHGDNDTGIDIFRSLSPTCQHNVMWRYFPFMPSEVITRAWTRDGLGCAGGMILVIYTSRNRLCFFGAGSKRGQAFHLILNDIPMERLLYDEPAEGGAISWFGAAPMRPYPTQTEPNGNGSDPEFHYTRASLMHVVCAEIYHDNQGASTGVLFRYSDGSSESIGQRRIGLSTTKITQANLPSRIHLRAFEVKTYNHQKLPCIRQCVEVQFSSGSPNSLVKGWCGQDMVGKVTWLFKLRKDIVQLSVEP